ncbi:hypothetical protein HDU85_001779 [Gaertneriomyces sp. JEL0708]|nr:hypothetical protein HDU85_001779 [Gaertneriomyces sp. JEL0708]
MRLGYYSDSEATQKTSKPDYPYSPSSGRFTAYHRLGKNSRRSKRNCYEHPYLSIRISAPVKSALPGYEGDRRVEWAILSDSASLESSTCATAQSLRVLKDFWDEVGGELAWPAFVECVFGDEIPACWDKQLEYIANRIAGKPHELASFLADVRDWDAFRLMVRRRSGRLPQAWGPHNLTRSLHSPVPDSDHDLSRLVRRSRKNYELALEEKQEAWERQRLSLQHALNRSERKIERLLSCIATTIGTDILLPNIAKDGGLETREKRLKKKVSFDLDTIVREIERHANKTETSSSYPNNVNPNVGIPAFNDPSEVVTSPSKQQENGDTMMEKSEGARDGRLRTEPADVPLSRGWEHALAAAKGDQAMPPPLLEDGRDVACQSTASKRGATAQPREVVRNDGLKPRPSSQLDALTYGVLPNPLGPKMLSPTCGCHPISPSDGRLDPIKGSNPSRSANNQESLHFHHLKFPKPLAYDVAAAIPCYTYEDVPCGHCESLNSKIPAFDPSTDGEHLYAEYVSPTFRCDRESRGLKSISSTVEPRLTKQSSWASLRALAIKRSTSVRSRQPDPKSSCGKKDEVNAGVSLKNRLNKVLGRKTKVNS